MSKHGPTGMMLVLLLALAGCKGKDDDDDDADETCDPIAGEQCECDPDDPDSCPDGYLCRPDGGVAVCVSESAAGRIPSCTDPEGMDVLVAEANEALSVSWKVNGAIDHAGGFQVVWGRAAAVYDESLAVGPDDRQATLRPLENEVVWYAAVEALDASGAVSFQSCEVAAVPHVLAFQPDRVVHGDTDGEQRDPDLASNADGTRLYLVFEDDGEIRLATSDDFGDSWTVRDAPVGAGQHATVAVRDAELGEDDAVLAPELAFLAWEDAGRILVASWDPTLGQLGEPVDVDAGAAPDLAVGGGDVFLAYEQAGGIAVTRSTDEGATFDTPRRLEDGLAQAAAPSVVVDAATGEAWVGFDAVDGAGDSNVYVSPEAAAAPVRADDDNQGQNQLEIALAIDPQTGFLYATWEDRRGGSNVYFSVSQDAGVTWSANVDVGVGLGGDQFRPEAVVDVASNVYVAFQDTSDGQKVVFSRFNEEGTFDPPLVPGTRAGESGIVGDDPSVATDAYGTVYVAWEENRDGPDADVVFARAE